jgi:mono/diheme cytochrome c family protein
MRLSNARWRMLLFAVLLVLPVASACGGLAGEPEVVATVPPRSNVTPNASSGAGETVTIADIPEDVDLALGAEIYAARCTACHGDAGAGDGAMVLNGQIQSIPDFTDPTSIANKTPADYFNIITNGVLDKLMPPWRDALSEDERWAVTMYTYNMAGGDGAVDTAGTTDTTTEEDVTSDAGVPAVVTTEEAEVVAEASSDVSTAVGTVRGVLLNGTEGASVPTDQEVVLHIMDMELNDNTYRATVDEMGGYVFDEIPFLPERGYMVTVSYQGGYFLSDMVFVEPTSPDLALDVEVFETTDDPSALHINTVVYQIEAVPGALEIGQYMVLVNNSDRVFVSAPATEDTPRTSVSFELPDNAVFTDWANDPQRYFVSDDGRTVYDTQAVMPGEQHLVQVVYSFEAESDIELTQSLPYPVVGVVDVYASDTAVEIVSDEAQSLEPQQFGTRMYNGWRFVEADADVDYTIAYRPENAGAVGGGESPLSATTTTNTDDNLPLGIALMFVGGGTIGAAGVLYWRARRDNQADDAYEVASDVVDSVDATSAKAEIDQLFKQIAELDMQYKQGEIAQELYESQRQDLKARLTALMKQQAN